MRKIITKDQSITFYNEEYQETYHSISGAEQEAIKKFVEPAMSIANNNKKLSILDVCFGLGYNSAAAIELISKQNPECNISITGLEKDRKILEIIPSINSNIKSYDIIKKAIKNNYEYHEDKISIKIILSDDLKSIKSLKKKFDIIFNDTFRPKKNPELWTESFFKDLNSIITKEGILTTYSCAGQVRRNLKAAGFNVKDGPSIGRRAPSTIAMKKKQ